MSLNARLDWRVLRVDGPDARQFLNGLLTQDVAHLPAWTAAPCCLLTPKGKLQAEFLIAEIGGPFLLIGAPKGIENAKATLGKMAMLSQSRVEDAGLAVAFAPDYPSSGPWRVAEKSPYPFVVADPRIRLTAALILAAPDKLPPATLTGEQFEALRVAAGVPLFGVDADEDCLPLEVCMDAAVSFNKGCYMGQETMSRIHHMGHVNRLLRRLSVAGARPGDPVESGDAPLGKVTSASPHHALALLKAEGSEPGARLTVGGKDAQVL